MSYAAFLSRYVSDSTSVQTTLQLQPVAEDDEPFANTPEPPTPYEWMDRALCAQVDPDLFFPTHQGSKICKTAQRVCAECPVREQCLEQALRVPACYDFGVWGGTTPPEREVIRRERRIPSIDLAAYEEACDDALGLRRVLQEDSAA